MKNRENALDLLRIISAILVIGAHTYTVPYHTVSAAYSESGVIGASVLYYTAYRLLASTAVPVFFMLSGAFIVASGNAADFKSFYKKTWKRLGIPTIIFTVFYFFEHILVINVSGQLAGYENPFLTSIQYVLYKTAQGKPEDHLWYMFCLIGIYLICPFVALFKKAASDKAFKWFIWIVWIWGTVSNLVQGLEYSWSLGFCVNMLGIFLLGYIAHEWGLRLKSSHSRFAGGFLLIPGLFLVAIVILTDLYLHDVYTALGGTSSYNPLFPLAAFFFVAAFTSMDLKADFSRLSASTLWVYLLHPVIMNLVFIIESNILSIPFAELGADDLILLPNLDFVIITVVTFALSMLLERLLKHRRSGRLAA